MARPQAGGSERRWKPAPRLGRFAALNATPRLGLVPPQLRTPALGLRCSLAPRVAASHPSERSCCLDLRILDVPMPEIVPIPLSDLLLDSGNPRLPAEKQNQQETALALAKDRSDGILRLAEDIVKEGLDPMTLTGVVATGDRRKRYRVVEGNRRVLAIKALEAPSLISAVLRPVQSSKLNALSTKYAENPVDRIDCVLFETEAEARHWIELRHTGENQGVGLVTWGPDEQDRFRARHTGTRNVAGQVLDFVETHGRLSEKAQAENRKSATTLGRLLSSPLVRRSVGVEISGGDVLALYPADELARSLSRLVSDLKAGEVTVPDVYTKEQREHYAKSFPRTARPTRSKRLKQPVFLRDLTSNAAVPRPATQRRPRRPKPQPRTTAIPKTAALDVNPPRINAIYNELLTLNAEQYPNACSVLLRVFIELSVDHVVEDQRLMSEQDMRNQPLSRRMKAVAQHLHGAGKIPLKLQRAVEKIADGQSVFGPALPTFNQYVHNQYVFPRPSELYNSWDEIAPFIAQIWP
jgi:hypothetical protein